jgi:2-polyprenyl-6-methoxyphenol hydroxylase-like FAD-dependent oxidoreductase
MKIAISGAGVAGPTLAYWLLRTGHEVTLVEQAPSFRAGGYVIDFWGVGYTIAERMASVFGRITNDRYTSLARGDLAAVVYRSVEERVEFDIVVSADGLHSSVRDLVFGPQNRFEKQLGYRVAAFEVEGYRPRDELVYVSYSAPGRQVARFAVHEDRTLILMVFVADRMTGPEPRSNSARKALLRRIFGDAGWECTRILDGLEAVDDIYFDRVSQIRMDSWSKGQVILIGDAAACVSLLAGEGTGLAMTQAYFLAGELARAHGDYRQAFVQHERLLRGFVEGKQKSTESFAATFAPNHGRPLASQPCDERHEHPSAGKLADRAEPARRHQTTGISNVRAPAPASKSNRKDFTVNADSIARSSLTPLAAGQRGGPPVR